MFNSKRVKLSIVALNLLVINVVAVQPALASGNNSGNQTYNFSKYIASTQKPAPDSSKSSDAAASALKAINEGKEAFADFSKAGVKQVLAVNKGDYDTAIAAAKKANGSDLTLTEVQAQVDAVNAAAAASALAAINGGTEVFDDFSTAGVKKAIGVNKDAYDTAVASAKETKGSDLTLDEVQAQVEAANAVEAASALKAINEGTEVLADFAKAGVTKAIAGNKGGYDTAVATTKETKGSDLTVEEVQAQVKAVNAVAAALALTAINGGKEAAADFLIAGVTKAVEGNKAAYDQAIAAAQKKKGSDLALEEVQSQVNAVNTAVVTNALKAINGRTDVLADFVKAGVKGALEGNKVNYDNAIDAAEQVKGSALNLAEVQAQVDAVNTAAAASALAAINQGTEVISDFAAAGVKGAVAKFKAGLGGYDSEISIARLTKGSDLTLEEVQAQVDNINGAVKIDALAAINARTAVFVNFAAAGVKGAIKQNKAGYNGYDAAIAQARKLKGSDLTLAEVQTQVDGVNKAVIATALTAINARAEVFADFAAAGIKGAVRKNKIAYDAAIANAKTSKGADLTLSEVQEQINIVNTAN